MVDSSHDRQQTPSTAQQYIGTRTSAARNIPRHIRRVPGIYEYVVQSVLCTTRWSNNQTSTKTTAAATVYTIRIRVRVVLVLQQY